MKIKYIKLFTLILKNYIMSFEYEMASNSSHSLMMTPYKLLLESVLGFLLYLIVSTLTLLTTVGLMVHKLITV